MQKINISAVSYFNTLPFIFGIQESTDLNDLINLSLDIPSVCAQKVIQNEVDLGLIPVAVIPQIKNSEIISDYCIGADGKVETVLLLSDVPKEEMQSIYLDYQSRTSVQLVQILAREYWHISPQWQQAKQGYESQIETNAGAVIIGDRTFRLERKYKYCYDLAEEWKKFTNLPFVFAAWVANKKLPSEFVHLFNKALSFGVQNIDTVISNFKAQHLNTKIDIQKYLTQDIQYVLDDSKRFAMDKFWNYASQNTVVSPKINC